MNHSDVVLPPVLRWKLETAQEKELKRLQMQKKTLKGRIKLKLRGILYGLGAWVGG